jgi:hypothetical protein
MRKAEPCYPDSWLSSSKLITRYGSYNLFWDQTWVLWRTTAECSTIEGYIQGWNGNKSRDRIHWVGRKRSLSTEDSETQITTNGSRKAQQRPDRVAWIQSISIGHRFQLDCLSLLIVIVQPWRYLIFRFRWRLHSPLFCPTPREHHQQHNKEFPDIFWHSCIMNSTTVVSIHHTPYCRFR